MSNTTLLNHFLDFYNVDNVDELAAELEAVYEQYTKLDDLINPFD